MSLLPGHAVSQCLPSSGLTTNTPSNVWQVAPDFLSYFTATAPLLDQDPSLWCVSAWNDHGQSGRALDNTALYRTDIIPGLGWLLNRKQAMTVSGQDTIAETIIVG